MMQDRKMPLAVISSLLLFAVCSIAQTPMEPRRDPWAGFEIGSWVVIQASTLKDGVRSEKKTKHVVAKFEDGAPLVDRIPEIDGMFGKAAGTSWHIPGILFEKSYEVARRQETLVINGKKLDCTLTEYVPDPKKTGVKARLILWSCNDVKIPYREIPVFGAREPALLPNVVRAEYTLEFKNFSGKYIVEVKDFDSEIALGTRKLTCVLETARIEQTSDGKKTVGNLQRWLSDEIPGKLAKESFKGEILGRPVELEKLVLEFEVKKPSKK